MNADVGDVVELDEWPAPGNGPPDSGRKNPAQQVTLRVTRALLVDVCNDLNVTKPAGAYAVDVGTTGAFLLDADNTTTTGGGAGLRPLIMAADLSAAVEADWFIANVSLGYGARNVGAGAGDGVAVAGLRWLIPSDQRRTLETMVETMMTMLMKTLALTLTLASVACGTQASRGRHPDGVAATGEGLFTTHCASCHGGDARSGNVGKDLPGAVADDGVDEIFNVVLNGMDNGAMPAFADRLSEQEIADIIASIETQ